MLHELHVLHELHIRLIRGPGNARSLIIVHAEEGQDWANSVLA